MDRILLPVQSVPVALAAKTILVLQGRGGVGRESMRGTWGRLMRLFRRTLGDLLGAWGVSVVLSWTLTSKSELEGLSESNYLRAQ